MESRSHKAESDGSYPEPEAVYMFLEKMPVMSGGFPVYTAEPAD